MKRILIINGHPDEESYNRALTEAYKQSIPKKEATVRQINIGELTFNPNLEFGYRKRTPLEPDLLAAIKEIREADHLVWVFPMWWYGYPAIMKGFIDRTFLPGITYEPIPGKPFPKKLLQGKTSRIIITADTPKWYDRLFMRQPALRQFKNGTLKFCGVKNIKTTHIAPIKDSTPAFRDKWLTKVARLGKDMN